MTRIGLFHHKSATRWIRTILREIAARRGARYRNFGALDPDHLAALRAGAGADYDLCSSDNVDYEIVAALPHRWRAFHVYRDPRDFVVSAYFSHLHSHPIFGDLAEHRERLAALPPELGIMLDIDWTERNIGYLSRITRWEFDDPRILDIKMEDLTSRPLEGFTGMLDFIGYPLDREDLAAVLDHNTFRNLSGGRRRGQEQPDSHYRKGVAGDWRNHFTPRVCAYFNERFGGLVERLGYAP